MTARMRLAAFRVGLAAMAGMLLSPALAQGQPAFAGRRVTAVVLEREGLPVTDPALVALVKTRVGAPLSMTDVRESIAHLDGLDRFDDIQVLPEADGDGVRLRYLLLPRHPVVGFVVRGALGLPEPMLRQAIVERFGPAPDAGRAGEVLEYLRVFYREAGYARAALTSEIEVRHDPDRSTLVVSVAGATPAPVRAVRVEGALSEAERVALLDRLGVRQGRPLDGRALRAALEHYERDLRGQGYYEARADLSVEFTPDDQVDLTIVVEPGARISLEFEGDPLPAPRQQLVPVEREASVDEDLLDGSAMAIEQHWKTRGYREAEVTHRRLERGDQQVIVFTTRRGRRAVVGEVQVLGASGVTEAEIRTVVRLRPKETFLQTAVDRSVAAIRALYHARGFARVGVTVHIDVMPSAGPPSQATPSQAMLSDAPLVIAMQIAEGPRTIIGRVVVEGTVVLSEPSVRALLVSAPGRPFTDDEVSDDRDRIEIEYRNRGYERVAVRSRVELADGGTRADLHFIVSEGPQVFVDQVIILGYQRIGRATIERELLVRSGEPLGAASVMESQRRLAALGLFRRVSVTTRPHGSEPRRDIVVQVEEAPPVSLDYGGGVGAERRLRPTAEGGQAEERLDVSPRGFVQLTRRNLWGKNRSASIFSRVSSLARDTLGPDGSTVTSSYGLNQYRLVGTFREPRVFGSVADLLVVATTDQSVRSSFNFRTRELVGRAAFRPSPRHGVTGTYTYREVHLFGETFSEAERPLIDRLFPQVALSMFGVSMLRDTRTDALDPESGSFVAAEQTLAARAYGSEVGFIKSTLEGKLFLRLPSRRRVVLALAGRLGAAHGFARTVGGSVVRDQLPASERFFAGGDTTVRGFSLDRLGDAQTITSSGFPTGGNGFVVLNAEIRASVTAALQGVVFVDAGNVYPLASQLSLTRLRPSAGFGVRYRSPVGPIRVDWGFNLNRRELVPGTLERGNIFHVSLGQAF
ncbi:MAG: POTRA domain-containing protein [Vicinamibacterales bacterium]